MLSIQQIEKNVIRHVTQNSSLFLLSPDTFFLFSNVHIRGFNLALALLQEKVIIFHFLHSCC